MYTIVSHYTKNTPYEEVVETYLKKSLEKYTFPTHIVGIENKGSWYKNTAEKARIILEYLENNVNDVVYLDADATIEQDPVLFSKIPQTYDVACHILDWNNWYGYSNFNPTRELLTGTLFLRNNKTVRELCKDWYNTAIKSNMWEQKALQNLLEMTQIKLYELPLEYCYMKSLPDGRQPLIKLNPVILHHQVSRKYKKIINTSIGD